MNQMSQFKIIGEKPLLGSVRIGGAKNASYKLMLAALLGNSGSRLLNFSKIKDVETVGEIITKLGGTVSAVGERALSIDPRNITSFELSPDVGEQGRFSSMFLAPLLARFGKAIVPAPGGDKIGMRPLGWHFDGLRALGAKIEIKNGMYHAEADKLVGTTYRLPKNTHTGTETLLIASVLAEGKTILENSAEEHEIDDLITFLNAMGAQIQRRESRVIEINGVKELHGAIHKIMPDQNEAVSYACAAIATQGDIVIENANHNHLKSFLEKIGEMGAGYEVGQYGIRFFHKGDLKAVEIETQISPGFKTDWQPLWATLATQAEGTSVIHETIYDKRFQYVDALRDMGAKIDFFQPEVNNPEEIYNFNYKDSDPDIPHAIRIKGKTLLKGGNFTVQDLRHGATLVIAGLIASGVTVLDNIEQIDRGYESLAERLQSLGANIVRK